jgi:hypothetical protein
LTDPTVPTSLDHAGRAVLPHRDPTFDAVYALLEQGEPAIDWRITGPKLITQATRTRGLARSSAGVLEAVQLPQTAAEPVSLNLQPDVARAVLRYLRDVAEPQRSRTGGTLTYRLKREPA